MGMKSVFVKYDEGFRNRDQNSVGVVVYLFAVVGQTKSETWNCELCGANGLTCELNRNHDLDSQSKQMFEVSVLLCHMTRNQYIARNRKNWIVFGIAFHLKLDSRNRFFRVWNAWIRGLTLIHISIEIDCFGTKMVIQNHCYYWLGIEN